MLRSVFFLPEPFSLSTRIKKRLQKSHIQTEVFILQNTMVGGGANKNGGWETNLN